MRSWDLIDRLKVAIGELPLNIGDARVSILDADTGIFSCENAVMIHWVNGQGEKVEIKTPNIAAFYAAIGKAHSQVLGAVMAGNAFQGPWISDGSGRQWAIQDVEVNAEGRWHVALHCSRIPEQTEAQNSLRAE